MAPKPKVIAGALGGALATVAVWLLALAGTDAPPEVAAAFATILGFVVAYLVPDRADGEPVQPGDLLIDEPPAEPTDVQPDMDPIRPEDG